jgi:nucleoside-diphosphate-sugar epimerase
MGYLIALAARREREFVGSNSFNFGPDSESLTVSKVVEIAQRHWMNQISVKFETGDTQQYEASRLDLNSELSTRAFGWIPVWNQEDAIVRTLSWWDSINESDSTPSQACENDINFAISKWGL